MNDLSRLRELVAQSCRILGKLNLTKEPSGHVSARVAGEEKILIKARGPEESGLRFVTARDVITVDFAGKKIAGEEGLESPQEVFIHTWLYRTRPDVQCVVHVHPLTVVLFTICNKPLLPLFGAYDPSGLRLFVEGLSAYSRSITVSTESLGEEFAQAMGEKPACLMRGHGITTAGAASRRRLSRRSNSMSWRRSIIELRCSELPSRFHKQTSTLSSVKPAARARATHSASSWRYYCRLLDE